MIDTERLRLTQHGIADFAEMAVMFADPQVARFLGGQPQSDEESWARLMRYAGSWAVRRREGGEYLGSVGFLDAHRTGVVGFRDDPEIGWSLNMAAQGQGYASEAVRAALQWGEGRFRRTVAMINTDNAASVAVVARCGFAQFSFARYKEQPVGLWEYRYPRP
jgi:RimJ/RimL family protein N-acetyltransferase